MKVFRTNLVVGKLAVEVHRKPIRNLHLKVLPPDGQVLVSGPLRMNDRTIRDLVDEKEEWIRHHQDRIRKLPKTPKRKITTGEMHPFLGKDLRLTVIENAPRNHVEQSSSDELLLHVKKGITIAKKRALLDGWYRAQMKARIPDLLEKWEPVMKVAVKKWGVRKMTSRWGSCNTKTARVSLNLELVKKAPRLLEYVVVHELTHLHERGHGKRFQKRMDRFLPEWKMRRRELDQKI